MLNLEPKPKVALFVTCLVDLFRPTVGFAAVKLLEDAGYQVDVPPAQTCCGQPAYNSGDKKDARAIASQVIEAFEDYAYIVAPSGSCGGMLGVIIRNCSRVMPSGSHAPRPFQPRFTN